MGTINEAARIQVLVNVGFSVLKAAMLVLAIRVADTVLIPAILGLVLLFRREATLWANVVQLGLSQSLLRYMPAARDARARFRAFRFAALSVVSMSALVCGIGWLLGARIAEWSFGRNEQWLGWSFCLLIAAIALGYIAGAAWFAELKLFRGNVCDMLNASLIFLAATLIWGRMAADAEKPLVISMAAGTFCVSLIFLLWYFFHRNGFARRGGDDSQERALRGAMIGYGLTRGSAAFAETATLTIGPWFLRSDIEQAGFLVIALTALRMLQTLISPAAQVIAIRAAHHARAPNNEHLGMMRLLRISLLLGVLAAGVYFAFGPRLLSIWIPSSSTAVKYFLDPLIITVPGLLGYYTLRNYVDVILRIPVNLIFLATSLVAFVVCLWILRSVAHYEIQEAVRYSVFTMMSMASLYVGGAMILIGRTHH